MGVGYIVGLNIACLVFAGGAFSWCVALPVYALLYGLPEGAAVDAAWTVWSTQIRYIGVGAMVVGGLWALLSLMRPIYTGIREGLKAYTTRVAEPRGALLRTEKDTPMNWVLWGVIGMVVPIFFVYLSIVRNAPVTLFMAIAMVVAGFLFSAVAGYMAGQVGSSNNPISGITIATILTSALMLTLLVGTAEGEGAAVGPAAAILIGAVVCCAAAIAGDNLQDLKAGHLLGATPWKQQVMQIVGTGSAALVVAPVLILLLKAYGLGAPTEEHPDPLTAPQATLMASVARGVFHGDLPWRMVWIGAIVGAVIIAADQTLKAAGARFRMPVLAVAVGIYLPLELSVPIFLGGLIAHFTGRGMQKRASFLGERFEPAKEKAKRYGLLMAAGLITGEAMVGILLAIPIVATGKRNLMELLYAPFSGDLREAVRGLVEILHEPLGGWPGLFLLLCVGALLYVTVAATFRRAARGK
jgi:putative OPT family oligopeptide transporter